MLFLLWRWLEKHKPYCRNHVFTVFTFLLFSFATVEIALATAIAGFLHVVTSKLVLLVLLRESAIRLRVAYKWNIHCMRVFTSCSWPHHCLYWMFLENICIYSHANGLVTHMLDCHDLASTGRIRGDLEVGIQNADWWRSGYTPYTCVCPPLHHWK